MSEIERKKQGTYTGTKRKLLKTKVGGDHVRPALTSGYGLEIFNCSRSDERRSAAKGERPRGWRRPFWMDGIIWEQA
jgi:hypothetical protein